MIVIVSHPRRATIGAGVAPADFPAALAVTEVVWGTDDDGQQALRVVSSRDDLTPAEQQQITDVCQSLNANEEALRQQARAALDTNRAFRNGTSAQLLTGADAIINDPNATANEVSLARGVKALTNQARALAGQNIALIRLALRDLDGTD